eukprot:g46385.t1
MLLLQFVCGIIVVLEEAQNGHVIKGVGGGVKMVDNRKVLLIIAYTVQMLHQTVPESAPGLTEFKEATSGATDIVDQVGGYTDELLLDVKSGEFLDRGGKDRIKVSGDDFSRAGAGGDCGLAGAVRFVDFGKEIGGDVELGNDEVGGSGGETSSSNKSPILDILRTGVQIDKDPSSCKVFTLGKENISTEFKKSDCEELAQFDIEDGKALEALSDALSGESPGSDELHPRLLWE